MGQLILPDTTLCAIVRDEIINPAGGIAKFVKNSVPFVEKAVIVDTGSKDGTREALEEFSAKYTNLRVLDRPFDGYSSSRNFSLKQAKTHYALVLDADERLSHVDFKQLRKILEQKNEETFSFDVLEIHPDKVEYFPLDSFQRLLKVDDDIRFDRQVFEIVERYGAAFSHKPYRTGIAIKHFVPPAGSRERKEAEWYDYAKEFLRRGGVYASMKGPMDMPSYDLWKKYFLESEGVYSKFKDLPSSKLIKMEHERIVVMA